MAVDSLDLSATEACHKIGSGVVGQEGGRLDLGERLVGGHTHSHEPVLAELFMPPAPACVAVVAGGSQATGAQNGPLHCYVHVVSKRSAGEERMWIIG